MECPTYFNYNILWNWSKEIYVKLFKLEYTVILNCPSVGSLVTFETFEKQLFRK